MALLKTDNFNQGGSNNVSIDEPVDVYDPTTSSDRLDLKFIEFSVFPNPVSDILAIQVNGILKENFDIELYDMQGKLVKSTKIIKGSTIWHLDTQTLYSGQYLLKLINGKKSRTETNSNRKKPLGNWSDLIVF